MHLKGPERSLCVILFHLPVPKETLFAFALLSNVGQGFGVSGREQERRASRTRVSI